MTDPSFAPPASQLGTPQLGALNVAAYPTAGQGLALGPDGKIPSSVLTSAMVRICDLTLGASQASFDTNTILGGNIPAIYNHLRLVLYLRGDAAAVTINPAMRFNNDSAADYDFQGNVQNNGAITANAASTSQTLMTLGYAPAASATAAYFGQIVVDIPNYANTSNIKAFTSAFSAVTSTAAAGLWNGQYGGAWINVAAVNRITVSPSAGNFVADSRFTLYGLT